MYAKPRLFHRTARHPDSSRLPGWRLLLPVWAWRRNAYSIDQDRYVDGWWWFALGFGVEPIGNLICGGKRFIAGVSFRITWGWIAFRRAS